MQDRENRYPADVAVRVFSDKKQYRAYALNVSASGACLVGVGNLAKGSRVTVQYLHLNIQARVVWSNNLATGVQFRGPLASADLQRLLQGAIGQHQLAT